MTQQATYDVITTRLDNLTDAHSTTVKKLEQIHHHMIDPDDGLYIRINDLEKSHTGTKERIDDAQNDIDKLVSMTSQLTSTVAIIERLIVDHEKRDEKFHEDIRSIVDTLSPVLRDYDRRMGIKKWTDKVIWFVLAALMTGMFTMGKQIFVDASKNTSRLERIERNITRPR